MKLRAIHDDEMAELQAFAAVEGRKWKSILSNESWWRGLPAKDKNGKAYPLLYGLRNSHGPGWLEEFRLPRTDA